MISETNVLIFSLLGGIVPALFWLWFWIREDRLRPEPKSALLLAFIAGIIALLLSLFFELVIYYLLAGAQMSTAGKSPVIFWDLLKNLSSHYHLVHWQTNFWGQIQDFLDGNNFIKNINLDAKKIFLVVIMAPVIEEILKFILAYTTCLRRKVNNEPIDASIYLLTVALGFASVETALFLTEPLGKGHVLDTLIASNFRSIGPMLIHLVSSALLGIFMGLAFYKSKIKKFLYFISGLAIAIVLHAIFNFFIILNETTHRLIFFWVACLSTWVLVIVLLVFFEKVKKVARKK